MTSSIASPFVYLLIGIGLGYTSLNIKQFAAAVLTRSVIPLVIAFNIATSNPSTFIVIGGAMIMMLVMLMASRVLTKEALDRLCFAYFNVGWLGLPVADGLYGNGAAQLMVCFYVGSSLFGNLVGPGLITGSHQASAGIRHALRSPPVWGLIAGLACMPWAGNIEAFGKPVYDALKFLMGFLGMGLLGLWLAKTPLRLADFRCAFRYSLVRAFVMFLLCSLFLLLCEFYGIDLVTGNKQALYLIALLPPAANVVVLETHYLKSGRSAGMVASSTCISIVALGLYVLLAS